MGIPRTLSLHESALSPNEYKSYVPLFTELVEPPESTLGVREARAWLKGRYGTLDGTTIDKILRLFHPALAAADSLSQGQFYAVLRLLSHVQNGANVDPALVFVQPFDNSSSLSISSSTPGASTPRADTNNNPVSGLHSAPHNSNNPFASRASISNTPGLSHAVSTSAASALSSDEGSVPEFVAQAHVHSRASSSPAPSIPNPFLARANSIPQSMATPPVMVETTVPPALPPRKPNFLPPPRHASQLASQLPPIPTNGKGSGSVGSGSAATAPQMQTSASREPPVKPPKPPAHVISPLIKQGLVAAKGAQRSAEQGLDKLRTWEVIKTSNGSAPNGGAPLTALPPRDSSIGAGSSTSADRNRSGSVSSGGQAPTARIQSTTRHARAVSQHTQFLDGPISMAPSNGFAEAIVDEDSPFATPDLPAASSTPTYRVSRSKSLHAAPPTTESPPVPPPRRKRPESAQLSPAIDGPPPAWLRPQWKRNGTQTDGEVDPTIDADGPFKDDAATSSSFDAVSSYGTKSSASSKRQSSMGYSLGSLDGHTSPMATLQRQFQNLQTKARPGLESARAKVEGKLIPGGYGKWGADGLTTNGKLGPGGISPMKRTSTTGHAAGASSEGSGEYEDAEDVLSTDDFDDVRRNGWKPLRG